MRVSCTHIRLFYLLFICLCHFRLTNKHQKAGRKHGSFPLFTLKKSQGKRSSSAQEAPLKVTSSGGPPSCLPAAQTPHLLQVSTQIETEDFLSVLQLPLMSSPDSPDVVVAKTTAFPSKGIRKSLFWSQILVTEAREDRARSPQAPYPMWKQFHEVL